MSDDVTRRLWRPEGYIAESRGVIFARWLTPLSAEILAEVRAAFVASRVRNPHGVASFSTFALDKRFPIALGFDGNFGEIRETLVAIRPMLLAAATVVEFEGFLAVAMRTAHAALQRVARPPVASRVFSRKLDGLVWLVEQLPAAVNPAPMPHYVRTLARLESEFECTQGRE